MITREAAAAAARESRLCAAVLAAQSVESEVVRLSWAVEMAAVTRALQHAARAARRAR